MEGEDHSGHSTALERTASHPVLWPFEGTLAQRWLDSAPSTEEGTETLKCKGKAAPRKQRQRLARKTDIGLDGREKYAGVRVGKT